MKSEKQKESKVYLIGSGIDSLASAVYLEKDTGVLAENIIILEKDQIAGGALDGAGDPDKGFVVRGGRMHEMHYDPLFQYVINRMSSMNVLFQRGRQDCLRMAKKLMFPLMVSLWHRKQIF